MTRHEAEERRLRSDAAAHRLRQFESAITQAEEAITIAAAAPGTPIVYVNPAFTRLTGYAPAEVEGRNPRFLQGPRTDPAVVERLRASLAAGKPFVGETFNYRKDGSEFLLRWQVAPVRAPDGGITYFVATQLAGGVAHDFNNLLTGILGIRAAALTRQLLAFSRRQVLEPRVISLNPIVQDLLPMLRRLISENIALDTRLDPALEPTLADPGQIEQVVLNLTLNARDAMPDGGRLMLRTENLTIDSAQAGRHPGLGAGRYAALIVSDTGVGMDQATRERIFEPFFTTKQAGQGSGLGLATVYGIMKQSHGYVTVASAPGRGATFTVLLPRAEPDAAPSGPGGPMPGTAVTQ